MKTLKKTGLLIISMVLLIFGNKAEAADIKSEELVKKTTEAMQQVKVLDGKMYVKNPQIMQYEFVMEIAFDLNAEVTFIGMHIEKMESKVWMDEKARISYSYDTKTNEYLFCPLDGDNMHSSIEVNTSDYVIDPTLKTMYLGEEDGYYKLQGVSDDQTISNVYYIDTDTYLIHKVENVTRSMMTGENMEQLVEYTYPENVVIPAEVKQKAELLEGYAFTKSNISYRLEKVKGKRVWYVTKSKKAKNTIKIPDTVSINGKKYDVYGIETKAFYNNSKIKSVTIGNNVRAIGDNAFYNNKKMTSLTIGKNVRTIGKQAFYKCKKLKNVKIASSNITKIGTKAFYGNDKTLKFKVPKKKATKYKSLLNKSKVSSKLVVSKS